MVPVQAGAADYPRTFKEFITRFDSEQACRDYIEAIRWRDGFICPLCSLWSGCG